MQSMTETLTMSEQAVFSNLTTVFYEIKHFSLKKIKAFKRIYLKALFRKLFARNVLMQLIKTPDNRILFLLHRYCFG